MKTQQGHRALGALWALLLLGVLARPALVAAASVKVYENSTLTTDWPTTVTETVGSASETVPLIEWGQTAWFLVDTGVDQANVYVWFTPYNSSGQQVFGIDAVPKSGNPANPHKEWRVGVDFGFWCDPASAADPYARTASWKIGAPQLVKERAAAGGTGPLKRPWTIDNKSGDDISPNDGSVVIGPGLWQIKVTASNNYGDPDLLDAAATGRYLRVMNPVGLQLSSGTPPWGTDTNDYNYANGNKDLGAVAGRRVLPGAPDATLTFGTVSHGRASATYSLNIHDRSHLYDVAPPWMTLPCRVKSGNMNPLDNPVTVNRDRNFDYLEYPPILSDAIRFLSVDGRDATQLGLDVPTMRGEPYDDQNLNGQRDASEPYADLNGSGNYEDNTLHPSGLTVVVSVPQYQPDTTYRTGQDAIEGIAASDPAKIWFDLDASGTLARVQSAGGAVRDTQFYPSASEGATAYESVGTYAEPYREFNLSLNVPTDFRLRVEEPALDLGKHPANTADNYKGLPNPWLVRPITVTNLGNVNLKSLRVSPDKVTTSLPDYKGQSGRLYTPDGDYDMNLTGGTRGLGSYIPMWQPEYVDAKDATRKYFWWSFGGEATADPAETWEAAPVGACPFFAGSLRKAQAGAGSPTSVQGHWEPGSATTRAGYVGPRVGVVTPFGQPVGEYSNQYLVYEDRNDSGLLDAGDFPALAPFRVKVTVTDRQLTEESTAYSIDRPVTGSVGHIDATTGLLDPTKDYADNFVKWTIPDAAFADGQRRIFSSDTLPAAARFRDSSNTAHRRLALFWSSNRPDAYPASGSGGGYRPPLPPAASLAGHEQPQSWYLYGTRSYEIKDADTSTPDYWPFWGSKWPYYDPTDATTRAATATPPEMKVPVETSLFQGKLGNAGTLVAEQYTAPSIVQTIAANDAVTAPCYLFFQGVGRGRNTETVGSTTRPRTYRASQIFYTQLSSDLQVPASAPSLPIAPEQPEVVKHTPRGLSYVTAAGTHYLWAFWQGGAENAWQGCYSVNYRDKTKASDWVLDDDKYPAGSSSARLPLFGDFTSVQDVTPMLYRGVYMNTSTGQMVATPKEFIDLVFTGFSKYRRTSDIYLARLDADYLRYGTRRAWRSKQPFARVRGENLSNTSNRAFASEHLEWMTYPERYTAGRAVPEPVFPRIYRWGRANETATTDTLLWQSPDPLSATAMKDATTGWKFDQERYCWSCLYPSFFSRDKSQATWTPTDLDGKNCTVTFYPLSGVVTFSLPINEGDRVVVDYTPQILRVAGSPQLEASPAAFLDTRYGPAQNANGARTYAARDRMWLFWTRLAPQVSKPTVWHKTMRLMVQLPACIRRGAAVTVTDEFNQPITQFTLDSGTAIVNPADPTQDTFLYPGRLYFPKSLQGRRITVSYTDHRTGAAGTQPLDPYIRWRDERPEAPLPIDDVANEGGLCAVPDLVPRKADGSALDLTNATDLQTYLMDPGTWRVWLFWASSRPKPTVYHAQTGQPVQFSNDTDLRYMTLAPRLDFRVTTPPAP